MDLTGKRRAFADARLAGKSNREAAIAAGCAVKSASQAGSRMAKHPDVVKFLEKYGKGSKETPPPPAPPAAVPAFDVQAAIMHSDPKQFLLVAMNDGAAPAKLRIEAAKALLPFMHERKGEGGKKDARADAAKAAAAGRFGAPPAPPRLVVGGKK